MLWRTRTALDSEELARRRGLLRTILIVESGGMLLGGVAALVAWFMAPAADTLFPTLAPFFAVAISVWAYRWSARQWYLAVYFYSFVTMALTLTGMYIFGGAQGPMGFLFIWIILVAGMLIDLRASMEMAVASLFLYGIFALGVSLGWLKLPQALYANVSVYAFPLVLAMMLILMALATRLFGGSLNRALEQARQLAGRLEEQIRQRQDLNLQLEDKNRQLLTLAESQQRRAAQLQFAADVSRAITQVMEPEELLVRVVDLIRERFDFYYVGLFLLDDSGRHAILQAGTGEAGRILRERKHYLEVGGQSMVGWVSANRKARIALDVGQEAIRFANPLLPDTRSEMALPLQMGERVLGVLDIQSRAASAFSEEDVTVLQGVADQVGVALENARLFQQTQAALKEIEATNRLLVREGWQGYLEQKTTRRAEFLAASGPVQDPLQGKAAAQTEPLTIPLELRGQSLGRLTLRREGNRAWSEDETQLIQTIAVQTVLAAENARLIEETQRTLGETRALYESSREITSAGEMSEVLAAVLNNLAHTGIHAAAVALFDAPTREQAKNIEMAGTWDYAGTPRLAPGVRFEIASFPLFDRITSEKALVSQDLLSDPAIDDMAKAVLGGLGLRAMAVTPLVARGQWMGVLFALMETAHTFTPSELNFHRALADQAAVAIDSRRLLAETQRRAEREALIRQIATRIRAAGDIQGVLETTATELARSMGVSRSIVRLTTGENV
jgi:GAF domain-containing protein